MPSMCECVCFFFCFFLKSNIAAKVSQQCEMLWGKIVERANVYVLNTAGPFIQLLSQNDGEMVTCRLISQKGPSKKPYILVLVVLIHYNTDSFLQPFQPLLTVFKPLKIITSESHKS